MSVSTGRVALLSFHTSPLAQPGVGDGGGMNVYVYRQAAELAKAGMDCDVYTRATRRGGPATVELAPGVRVHHVPAGPLAPVPTEDLGELVEAFTEGVSARFEAEGPPDVIHAHYWLSGLAGHVLKHRFERPLVCTFHTLARVKAASDPGFVAGTSGAGSSGAGSSGSGPSGRNNRRLGEGERGRAEAEIIGCSDAIVVSSTDEADQLERLYGAVPHRIEVVAPGVDHRIFTPGDKARARAGLGLQERPTLLFVGRIQPLKGVDLAVATLGDLDRLRPAPTDGDPGPAGRELSAQLLVVGGPSGPQGPATMSELRAMVAELGLVDRVHFLKPRAHELLAPLYQAADVCLVPSRSESFGLVALEAAACGTPVVASAVGGLAHLVRPGRTGYLVETRDPGAFAQRVASILADPLLAETMGRQAAKMALAYRWCATAARLRRLYGDLRTREPVECG
ncbi:MAG: glycosyltransferase [Acidimicrobiales bacterium]